MPYCEPCTLPFPEVTGTADARTIWNLHEDLASAASEMTALTSYMYQHTISGDEDYSACMLTIAKDEMTHAEMLMDAIHKLGGDPRYQSSCMMWSACFTDYAADMCSELRDNIDAETKAIATYRQHIEETTNSSVRQLLERIICDEQRHLEYFRQMLAIHCE